MGNFGLYDLGIVLVVVLGVGGYQLWSVSRAVARDRARKAERPAPPPSER